MQKENHQYGSKLQRHPTKIKSKSTRNKIYVSAQNLREKNQNIASIFTVKHVRLVLIFAENNN